VVKLSSTNVSFGNQALGTASAAQGVTLTNNGSGILNITNIAVTGPNGGDFGETNGCGTSVAPTASCTISVTFTPTAPGVRSGTLTITDNAAGNPHTIALTGTGAGPGATLSPASLTFAAQVDNTPSAAQTITLTNSGTAALTITSVAASGDFAETNNCGASVAAGANCAVHVTFTPTTAGSRSGTLTITDNASGSPQTAALSGTGTDFAAAPATGSGTTATVTAGGTATYTLAFTGTPGFTGTVSLTCMGAPALATCTVSPSSLPLSGTTAANATVSVTTTARSIVAPRTLLRPPAVRRRPIPILPWLALAMLALCGAALALRASHGSALPSSAEPRSDAARWRLGLATGLLFIAVLATMAMPACGGGGGGGGGGGNPGTPAGTYTLAVTATVTSGTATLTHQTNLTLTVN
jgi:VCBS repeat-containing protein